ncbi:protein CutA homolog [Phlebotomus argentipes]|uniref:protein CutA homolog n=1 Tax=Phlebotomus argentipes TaxID=94469 RepID=UPI002893493B|nr:protein CutA homolog [Phlebotomus argentipes]
MRLLSKVFIGALYLSGVPLLCRSPAKFNLATMSSSSSKYEPGTHSVAFVTTPDENSAKKLAHLLLNQKLAACINIVPQITSIYDWDGKISEDSEVLMMIKTRTSRVDEICKLVRDNHSYSVAEVISLPIENGNPPYMEWLSKSVPDKT